MSRRGVLLAVGALALLGLAGFVTFLYLTRPAPGVTPENFQRLRLGMTESQVEAVLGSAGEDYPGAPAGPDRVLAWDGPGIEVVVYFTKGRVSRGVLLRQDGTWVQTEDADNLPWIDRLRLLVPW